MKFYVAANIKNKDIVAEVRAALESAGHEMVTDWTLTDQVPEHQRENQPDFMGVLAERDLRGVQDSDVFVILGEKADGRSMYVELGIALALNSKFGRPIVYAMGRRDDQSIFHYLPQVHNVQDIQELLRVADHQPLVERPTSGNAVQLEEFKALRAEMLDIMKDRIWGQATYAVIVAGSLAFALSGSSEHKVSGLIFLIALAFPFLSHTVWREHARIRMGNYLRAVVEPALPGLGWEKYLAVWRSRYGREEQQGWLRTRSRITHVFALSGLFLITSVFAFVLLIQSTSKPIPVGLGCVLMAALLAIYAYFFRLYDKGQTEFQELQGLDLKL